MSNQQENKKLNKLDIKKETITDLNVENSDDVKGGGLKTNEYPACGCGRTNSCPPSVGCIVNK